MPKKLSEQQESEAVSMYVAGKSTVEVGKILGVHNSTIRNILKATDTPRREAGSYSRNFSDEEEAKIARLYLYGISAKNIAKLYGLKHHISIVDAIKRQGVEQRPAPERNRIHKLNNTVFDSVDNENAAYWLGFLYADGSTNDKSLSVSLKGVDFTHLEKLKSFLKTNAPVTMREKKCKGKGYASASLYVTDRHLIERLHFYGVSVGRHSPNETIERIPEHLFRHWLRGLFDGDGCAFTNPNSGINFLADSILIESIRNHLVNAGVDDNPNRKINKHSKSDVYYLSYSGRKVATKVIEYMYQDATIWLDRKRQVIASWPVPMVRTKDHNGQRVYN